MSQGEEDADRRAAAAVIGHHAELSTTLQNHLERLREAAERDDPALVRRHRDALVDWVRDELLPHARAEESTLYAAAAGRPEGALLVAGMRAEHETIGALADELSTAATPVGTAAAARALAAVFATHLAKENDLILPLLAGAPDVALADLLAGMHDLIGGQSAAEPGGDAGGCGCGGCGCGDGAAQGAAAPVAGPSVTTR